MAGEVPAPLPPDADACKNCGLPKDQHPIVNHVGTVLFMCPTSLYDTKKSAEPAPA